MEWQPIATAPRDRAVLVWIGGDVQIVAAEFMDGMWWELWENTIVHPGYWMPLPAAPEPVKSKPLDE